jgi:hypothetical protein
MNKTQLEYAVKRLDSVHSDKWRAIKEQHAKAQQPFDGNALVKAIKSGKVTINTKYAKRVLGYCDISECFDGIPDKEKPTENEAFKKAVAPLEAEHSRIRDQLYLGDAKEALALIEAFAAKKF